MYSSTRHGRRGRNRRRKGRKLTIHSHFSHEPEPWQNPPPQTPPSSDDEQPATPPPPPQQLLPRARLPSTTTTASALRKVGVAPKSNSRRRLNTVRRKISKYVKLENASVLQSVQPQYTQCTAPVPLPRFVKSVKSKVKVKQTAPVPLPTHILHSKSKKKSKAAAARPKASRSRAKVSCRPKSSSHSKSAANPKSNSRHRPSRSPPRRECLVTANAPRNPHREFIDTVDAVNTVGTVDAVGTADTVDTVDTADDPYPVPNSMIFIMDKDSETEPEPIGQPPAAADPVPTVGAVGTVVAECDDKENIDFALIPEAYYIGNDLADLSTENVMDLDISIIEKMAAGGGKETDSSSPISRGSAMSAGGTEITSFSALSMADSWNEQQYGYNAQSETTDFTTNSDSSVTTKPQALTKAAEENVVESPQALLFGDDQFHLLAEQIMAEHQSPRAQRMQSAARRPEPQSFLPWKSAAGRNIWREPSSTNSCSHTLAGLLMNGLEPISTQLLSPRSRAH